MINISLKEREREREIGGCGGNKKKMRWRMAVSCLVKGEERIGY